ncbi:hypothetical protein CHS0354_013641, partial [Potamilus streckersoni]
AEKGHGKTVTHPAVPVPENAEDKQGPIIPVEILHMDNVSLVLYKKALQDGMEKVYNCRVMVVGQFGVGKTTLTKRLLGHQVDISERKSTEGIDVYKHCCKISLDTGQWIVQHEDSDELSRLQRLMTLLSRPDLNSNVRQDQEGHMDVVYKRETTPDVDNTHMSDTASSSGSDQEDQLTYSQPALLSSVKMDGGLSMADSDQKTATVTIKKSEEESSRTEKKDAVIEILHLINQHAEKLEKDTVKYAALSIWDFAGQYAFYTTHQTFLSSRALYLLVIDLNQQITDLIEDDKCFLDIEGIKPCKVHDLVEIWMNSIHTCAPSPNSSIPHVILVGTHVDKLSEKSRKALIDRYFKTLRYLLKDKPTICHLMDDIAIDNTMSDPMLETLKRRIFELASKQSHWGEEKPARWLPLEQAIMTLRDSGTKVVARSLIEEINVSGSVRIEDREELDLFFRFHHEMGTILYFSIEALREKIVLDPQWLINALKSLITAETFIQKKSAITSKWYEFKETGKLTHELIDAIWTKKEHPDFHDNKEHILLVMEKLNIIARPRSYGKDETIKEENYFLVPCMLRQATPKEIISPELHPEEQRTSILCFMTTEKFLPPPVFHRLIGACLTHWPIAKQNSENLIYCGCCLFDIDLHHRLVLYFRNYVIFSHIMISAVKDEDKSSERCREARKFILKNLSELIGNAGNSLQLHVQCPDSEADSLESLIPVSHLRTHDKVPCRSHKKSHMLASQRLLKFWFKEKGNQGEEAEENDKLHHMVLDRCRTVLLRDLNISTVTDHIYQEDLFNDVTMRDILDQKTTSDKIRELIKQIKQSDWDTYVKFKACVVKSKQADLKAMMEKEEALVAKELKVAASKGKVSTPQSKESKTCLLM